MKADAKIVGVLGASSLVGQSLLEQLLKKNYRIVAFSRRVCESDQASISWCHIEQLAQWQDKISLWVCLAPIWVLPQYFDLLQACGARRIIALSSTSIFTKQASEDIHEQQVVASLKEGESALEAWAVKQNIQWCVLRPTLVYGYGRDKNVSEIARFITRFGFFPLWGSAKGLRQPIHADDVAEAGVVALLSSKSLNCAYNISGKEVLSYEEMVKRIFESLGLKVRIIRIPLWFFRMALFFIRLLPKYRHWTVSMAERMNRNLVFDHTDAEHDLNFAPRSFLPKLKDLKTQ
jgi:nucleoside-diphosphate-sugar epimerase